MSKKESPQKSPSSNLPLINPNAAGIDIGADRHWVSVPVDRDKDSVRSFGCFTALVVCDGRLAEAVSD